MEPNSLKSNKGKSFRGGVLGSEGFIISKDIAEKMIQRNERNKAVLFPRMTGIRMMENPTLSNEDFIIDFGNLSENESSEYNEPFEYLKGKIREQSVINKNESSDWWRHKRKHNEMIKKVCKDLPQVLISSAVQKYPLHVFVDPLGYYFDSSLMVLARASFGDFAILESCVHDLWVNKYSIRIRNTIRYSSQESLDNFPFPSSISVLEDIGKEFYELRQSLLVKLKVGLSKFYNFFNSPESLSNDKDLVRFRQLKIEMDQQVLACYGWSDLTLNHNFYELDHLEEKDNIRFTIHPKIQKVILKRLLELNQGLFKNEE